MEKLNDRLNIEKPATIEDAARHTSAPRENFYSSLFNATLYTNAKFVQVNVEMLHWTESGELCGSIRLKPDPTTPAGNTDFIAVVYSPENGCWGIKG